MDTERCSSLTFKLRSPDHAAPSYIQLSLLYCVLPDHLLDSVTVENRLQYITDMCSSWQWLGKEMYGEWGGGLQTKR